MHCVSSTKRATAQPRHGEQVLAPSGVNVVADQNEHQEQNVVEEIVVVIRMVVGVPAKAVQHVGLKQQQLGRRPPTVLEQSILSV